mgnify:CR=1 FL=1
MAKYVGAQPRVSGNRLAGGTIETFSSTGIDDSASTVTNLTITDTTQTQTGTIVNTATTGIHTFDADTLAIDTDNDRIGINVAAPAHAVDISGQVLNIYHDDAGAAGAPTIILDRDSASPAANDQLATFCIKGRNDADESTVYAEMYGHIGDPTDGAEKGEFDFNVMAGGTLKSVMMLTPDEVTINDGASSLNFHVKGDSDPNLLFANTVTSRVGIGTLTPSQKLHVVGDVLIDGTITFSDTAAGSGAATFTIRDENNADSAAQAKLNLEDSDGDVLGSVELLDGDMVVGADDQLLITTDRNNSYGALKSAVIYAHKRLPEAVRLNGVSTLTIAPLADPEYFSEQTACTITTSSTGEFSSFTVGDVCKIEGCTNAANNQLTRIMTIVGDVMTVHGFRTQFVAESGGSITLSEGGGPCMHIPPYVNFTYATYPQTQNNSRVATMRYVRTAISELIDTSPSALDTLNELAAAIGDDANFATTINTALTNRVNIDFDNLSATGIEALNDYIGEFATNSITTFAGTGNSLTLSHNDANNAFDFAVNLNDPDIEVTLTGDVTGTTTATMTDLQDVTISVATTLGAASVNATALVTAPNLANVITGLTRITSVQNSDDLIVADADDGFALKKIARSIVAPPGLDEGLGFFAIAMS